MSEAVRYVRDGGVVRREVVDPDVVALLPEGCAAVAEFRTLELAIESTRENRALHRAINRAWISGASRRAKESIDD